MKKITTLFILCAWSLKIVHAGEMGKANPVCSPEKASVSCPFNAWDIGISALYLQPNTSSALLNPMLNTDNGQFYTVDSPWDGGFLLEGSYHFNAGNDLNLNWLHFDADNSDRSEFFFRPIANVFAPLSRVNHLKFSTNLDVINFEFAQFSHFGKKNHIRFYGGGQYVYAKIKRSAFEYEQLSSESAAMLIQESITHTQFQGVGPRLGMEMSHDLQRGFGVFAQSAMTLLTGEGKVKLSGANLSGPRITPFGRKANQTHIVPELEAKLGASYQWSARSGQFSVMAGWMWQYYFNMFLLPPGERRNPATTITQHNLSLDGPFIKGKWVSE